ncbi:phytoene/squalene synthase family protein [Pinisolibacter aquiterrae]|uniref:phytoene/squalene synthase family protein n=1 Tax=Pinisolibacter aquiterrae TaxID=2815579 RepID=UPI001E285603|nr:phytoene/squalene synthase family protein [Pinisolibacter aquiterrae]MCC8235978.1 squalene/phytoene synthase family protein [Pinisolibacter aquiterrae]
MSASMSDRVSDSAAPSVPAAAPFEPSAAYAVAAERVRAHDHDRWLAGLWAPEDRRRHLYALYAFSDEIARIRDVVSDPLPGEVRARWWADMLAGTRGGEGAGHPIAAALLDTIRRFDLPPEPFERLIEARIFDLYDDPMPTLADLDTYCDDTVGSVVGLACRILDGACDGPAIEAAITAAGRAWGVTGLLRALPFHASRGQIFLPVDLVEAHGVDRADLFAGRATPALRALHAALRAHARDALAETRRRIAHIPIVAAPAFLPLALVDPWLDRMDRPDFDPFHTSTELAPWHRHWRLWRSARRARRAARRRGELM